MDKIEKLIKEISELTKKRAELYKEYCKLGYEKAVKWFLLVHELAEHIKEQAKKE